MTPILVDHKIFSLESLSPYLSIHIKNGNNGGRLRLARQFKGNVVLDSELEINIGNK
jgi:hypothetical protein